MAAWVLSDSDDAAAGGVLFGEIPVCFCNY